MTSEKTPAKKDNSEKDLVRLNKLLAERGLASRRGADKLIAEGLVMVNGKKVYELGIKVNPNKDKILVDGKPIKSKSQNIYVMFNKPKNVITSMNDPLERPTVADFVADLPARVFPIGRLDWDSEGLLLLTNDGEFAQKVMHPKTEVTKTYHVKLEGQPQLYQIKKLLTGVSIPGGRVKAKHVEKLKPIKAAGKKTSDKNDWYKIVITEGKNHQVREMFKKIGFDVLKLHRVAIGKLRIGQLGRGEMVFLNEAATQRVFLPDLPEETHGRRDVRHKSKRVKDEELTRKKFDKALDKK
ncbi:rRNA pseudouridine synthase [bacterium]|nr:rRNA pseudouridine synthase [bacterium]